MLLEGGFEAAQVCGAHGRRTTSSRPGFRTAARPHTVATESCGIALADQDD
jgi:hypothetical protein